MREFVETEAAPARAGAPGIRRPEAEQGEQAAAAGMTLGGRGLRKPARAPRMPPAR
ncbi:hypothetical protein [Cryobacterium sp. GrIS_2_6]|uniref:hypothetical protein n=1 Tax=Cryobacterium sp. GrIS_2_6 TaxID=3162785 RepID=UPI002DFC74C5|nr:hypothetical protein [Cryobacterium psychrotolerans]